MARENPTWGYRRVHGELVRLGHAIGASTVWQILKNADIDRAPTRTSATPAQPLRSQAAIACDFATDRQRHPTPRLRRPHQRVQERGMSVTTGFLAPTGRRTRADAAGPAEIRVTQDVARAAGQLDAPVGPLGGTTLRGILDLIAVHAIRPRSHHDSVVTDPVCGMRREPLADTISTNHLGEAYRFCAPLCQNRFENDRGYPRRDEPARLCTDHAGT